MAIGFGRDGSVEWERFRIYNPPIMVPDGTKQTVTIGVRGVEVDNFKEDAGAALREVIAHNIKLAGKPGARITPGKVGNTTSTFYSELADGHIGHINVVDTWANVRNATAGTSIDTTSSYSGGALGQQGPAGTMSIRRSIWPFITSAIPDTDVISAATNSYYIIDSSSTDNDGDDWVNIYLSTPSNSANLVLGDFDQISATSSATQIDITSIATGAYKDWTLNATGLANISTSTTTVFALREGHDVLNSEVIDGGENTVNVRGADTAGTTQDPKLVVVHAAPITEEPIDAFLIAGD